MEFLRNAWYMAAWSNDLTPETLVVRTLLDDAGAVRVRQALGKPIAEEQEPERRQAGIALQTLGELAQAFLNFAHP